MTWMVAVAAALALALLAYLVAALLLPERFS